MGGESGAAEVLSISRRLVMQNIKSTTGAVTAVAWSGARRILATKTGGLQVFEDGSSVCDFSRHSSAVTAIAVHPSGDILASASLDKSLVFYDLSSAAPVTQLFTSSGTSRVSHHPS